MDAVQIGVIAKGQQEGNKIVSIGALYNDEFPDVVEFFKKETSEGNQVNFSWEIRYKNSQVEDEIEWLTNTTTKAITAVKSPAYHGRTPLVSISSFDLVKAIDDVYKYPLRQSATDILNRQMRAGISDEDLAELAISLRNDDRLSLREDEVERQEPRIICSIGLFKQGES